MRLHSLLSIFYISNLNKVGVNAKNVIRVDSNNKRFATTIDDRYLIDQNPSKTWEKHPYSLRELVLKKRLNDTESIGWGTDALTYASTRVDDDDKNIPIFNYTNRTLIVAFQNQYHTQLKSNEFKQSLCENVVASMLVLGSMTDNCTILHSCLINDLKVPLMLELTAPLIPERCLFDWKINKDI